MLVWTYLIVNMVYTKGSGTSSANLKHPLLKFVKTSESNLPSLRTGIGWGWGLRSFTSTSFNRLREEGPLPLIFSSSSVYSVSKHMVFSNLWDSAYKIGKIITLCCKLGKVVLKKELAKQFLHWYVSKWVFFIPFFQIIIK